MISNASGSSSLRVISVSPASYRPSVFKHTSMDSRRGTNRKWASKQLGKVGASHREDDLVNVKLGRGADQGQVREFRIVKVPAWKDALATARREVDYVSCLTHSSAGSIFSVRGR